MLLKTTRRLSDWDLVRIHFFFSSQRTQVYVADRSVLELLETHIRQVSPSRMEELIKIFIRATELEISFWDMGLGDHPRAHMTSLSA